ncbi:hypothetical protein CC86DRAFT_266718, partial [Ophiobolus disseminans]
DFYSTYKTPYSNACAMLQKARELGNPSSRASAAQFFYDWQLRGSPFRDGRVLPSSQGENPLSSIQRQSQGQDSTDTAFCIA